MNFSPLFPPRDARIGANDRLTRLLEESGRRVALGSVTPRFDPTRFHEELSAFDFAAPTPLDEMIAWTVAGLETGVVHMNHPRYFGLFNPAPTFPAQCADRIAATFNPQLATATTSPAAVAIEAHVIAALARRAGFPDGTTGHFTTGGSEANGTALICALTKLSPAFSEQGARAFAGQPVFYISADSHLAWLKLAHQAGIGRAAARLIPTDGFGRMSIPALEETISADQRAGCVPFLIVATAGTTNAGMIDPLGACADVSGRMNIWFHVDAAWGGAAIASDRLRTLLAGMERADSVTIDAHKWFATTMGCGMFLTPRAGVLTEAFNVATSYMPSRAAGVDPYVTTAQWSRRFLGIRLFLALGAAGWAGFSAHVEHAVDLIGLLREQAEARGWRVVNDPALAVACLAPPAGSPPVAEIVRRVLASGQAWVSAAMFEGRAVVRACVTHGETSVADIADLVAVLERARLA